MKRICIYVTYDKENIIDDYVGYFLRSIRSVADTIVVVCNMPRVEKGAGNLLDYADEIFYRENRGLDAGGFKDALCTFVGWNKMCQYDELILANDSFYGPFTNMEGIFSQMESRGLDFWGLMKRGAGEYGKTGRDPEHILSFFYVFEAKLLHSKEFYMYWEQMPYYRDYMEVVKKYERQLTQYFAGLGYQYGTYANTESNETSNLKNQFFQCDYLAYEMMAKNNFPFLKRKQLSNNTLYAQTQENPILSIEYVDKHTDYDVNLIWKNLIRTQNHAKLQRSLGLQYILGDTEEQSSSGAMVCVCVSWMNALENVCEYLDRIKDVSEVKVFTGDAEAGSVYQKRGFTVEVSEKSDADILQSIDTGQYRYICLIHDMDLSSDRLPGCTGKSYFLNVWENLVKSAGYIRSVIKLLDEKAYLGMLVHPVPIFSTWLGKLGSEWKDQYDRVIKCAGELGLHAVIERSVPPVHMTDNFWIRADAIRSVGERLSALPDKGSISKGDFRYLWNFLVQDAGLLTGIAESTFYASMNEANYHFYIQKFMELFTDRYGRHSYLYEFEEIHRIQMAVEECRKKYATWYVYGTGETAERCFEWLREAAAFVVSDGQPKEEHFHGKKVLSLSEIDTEEVGIILCLSRENQDQVVRALEEKGIKGYYTIY